VSADLRVELAVRRARCDDGAVSLAVYAVVKQIEAEISCREHFKSLGEAASRILERLDRARRVVAPSPQAASERRKGITTTHEGED
jgi:hypothetical protein